MNADHCYRLPMVLLNLFLLGIYSESWNIHEFTAKQTLKHLWKWWTNWRPLRCDPGVNFPQLRSQRIAKADYELKCTLIGLVTETRAAIEICLCTLSKIDWIQIYLDATALSELPQNRVENWSIICSGLSLRLGSLFPRSFLEGRVRSWGVPRFIGGCIGATDLGGGREGRKVVSGESDDIFWFA